MILRYILFSLALLSLGSSEVLDSGHVSSPVVTDLDVRGNEIPDDKLIRRSSIQPGQPLVPSAGDLTSRQGTVLQQIRAQIPVAIQSVEHDIAIANRDRVILATSNFLGMVFGVAKATGGSVDWESVSPGNKIQVFAQILYGYGYWGPFALEYEDSRVDCGFFELERALDEFAFIDHPQDAQIDTTVAQYYATELNHAMKRNLYCLTSRKGSNQSALELDTLIDLYTQLQLERLA